MATVDEIVAQQIDWANDAVNSGQAAVNLLTAVAGGPLGGLREAIPGMDDPTVLDPIPDPGYYWDNSASAIAMLQSLFPASGPTVPDIDAEVPEFDGVPTISAGSVSIPESNIDVPGLDIPPPPTISMPTLPDMPGISDPVLPSAPTLAYPTAPAFASISLPEVPSITIPTMTASLPVDDLVVPTNSFAFYEEIYSSAMLSEAQSKLLDRLQNGGYGIEPGDEAALFDRARSRELEAGLAQLQTLTADAASRGFPLPPGDLNVAMQVALRDQNSKLSAVNREIALKRADLYVDNYKFTLSEVRQLETVLIGYHNSKMERFLNSQRALLDANVKIFELQVARYNARVERYKADAQVLESRIRGQALIVEVYRAQMEGKKIESDIQRAQVELYNAQLNGLNTIVNLYKTQTEAAAVVATIERTRIDAYRALIEGFAAQIQYKAAEINLFEARIKGETAKIQAAEVGVRAYAARVEAAQAAAQVNIANVQAQVAVSGQQVDAYKARISGFEAEVAKAVAQIDAVVKVYGSDIAAAAAKANATGDAYKLDVQRRQIDTTLNIENARLAVEKAKNVLQGMLAEKEILVKGATGATDYYKAYASGAVNALTALVAKLATE